MPPWTWREFFGAGGGPLRGLVEVATADGSSHAGLPPGSLAVATDVALLSAGGFRKRPGRYTVTNYTSRTSPGAVVTDGTYLYDCDAGTGLQKGATSVVAGMSAANLSSAVFVDTAGTKYLIVCDGTTTFKKINNTTATAITGLSSMVTNPASFAVAAARIFASNGSNYLAWTQENPNGTSSAEWDAANYLTVPHEGLKVTHGMIEFGGLLYLMGSSAVLKIDPRSPSDAFDIELSGVGVNGKRAFVKGKDAIFFTDGYDCFRWTPGALPVSIARSSDGRSLVQGIIRDVTASNPFDVMGFDPLRDLVFLSNDTTTLVYDLKIGAWTKWAFGADSWCFFNGAMYYTETGLTETLTMDWAKNRDTIAGTGTNFAWTVQTHALSSGFDSEIRLKNLKFHFSGDTSLSDSVITASILTGGIGVYASSSVSMTTSGVFTLDSSVLDGPDVLGGGGGDLWARLAVPYTRSNILSVSLTAQDNNPVTVYGVGAQIQPIGVNLAN